MTRLVFEKDLPAGLEHADDLPSLPAVALEVLRLTQDENSTLDELAACLSRDPALAAKLLKLANSPLFSPGHEVTTLQRAAMMLGLKTVKLMSLSFSLAGAIPKDGNEGGFDLAEYWRRSLVCSVAARSLARLGGGQQGDEAFLCGLLVHFGRLVLSRVLGEPYRELYRDGRWVQEADEERSLGFSNVDLCATLLRQWQLPEIVWTAVGHWRRPEALPADASQELHELTRTLELTAFVERVLCDEEKGPALIRLRRRANELHRLTEAELDAFLLGLESGIAETAELLSVELDSTSHEEVMRRARSQIVDVSLGTAVDLQQTQREKQRLEEERQVLACAVQTDHLTGLPNRARFDAFLAAEIERRIDAKEPRALGLVLIDVDHFKRLNDTHGHPAGDAVLRALGQLLTRQTRKGDLSARYGGEEFALVATHATPFGMRQLVERLRRTIESERIPFEGRELRVTASFGAACIAFFRTPEDAAELVKLADQHLYQAKQKGRNRWEMFQGLRFPHRF